jgi:GT2 family glycosyltransferase
MKPTLQIQAVLFHNDAEELRRALRTVDQAAKMGAERFRAIRLCWGDASAEPLFSEADLAALRQACPHLTELQYVFFAENTGYGEGNNRLALSADADYHLIMNPEICLPPLALCDLLEPFDQADTGIVEARQIPVEHPKAFDPETMETEWSSGACFLISGPLFRELGGFDTRTFFMYCEDVDLSWRIRLAGKKLYYQPLAGVFHARRLSDSGRNQASRTEVLYTVLSEALLAYKWSRPEYARARIELAVRRGDPGAKEAQDAFRKLEKQGRLPDFLDPEHRIARIIQYPETGGMLFTQHRYEL